jgi:hypothetical protein
MPLIGFLLVEFDMSSLSLLRFRLEFACSLFRCIFGARDVGLSSIGTTCCGLHTYSKSNELVLDIDISQQWTCEFDPRLLDSHLGLAAYVSRNPGFYLEGLGSQISRIYGVRSTEVCIKSSV